MRELAWHLFTWGDRIRVVGPPSLQDMLVSEIEVARKAHVRF